MGFFNQYSYPPRDDEPETWFFPKVLGVIFYVALWPYTIPATVVGASIWLIIKHHKKKKK